MAKLAVAGTRQRVSTKLLVSDNLAAGRAVVRAATLTLNFPYPFIQWQPPLRRPAWLRHYLRYPPTRTATPGAAPCACGILRLHLAVDFAQRTLAGTATWWLAEPATTGATELVLDTRDLCLERISLGETSDGPPAAYQFASADAVLG